MQFNIDYVDSRGQLTSASLEASDVKAAVRQALLDFPDATRVYRCIPADMDSLKVAHEPFSVSD